MGGAERAKQKHGARLSNESMGVHADSARLLPVERGMMDSWGGVRPSVALIGSIFSPPLMLCSASMSKWIICSVRASEAYTSVATVVGFCAAN